MKQLLFLTLLIVSLSSTMLLAQSELKQHVNQGADEAAAAKTQWIAAHPTEYKALNSQPATDYTITTPQPAEIDGADFNTKQQIEAEWQAREAKHQTWLQQQAAKQEAERLAVQETSAAALTVDAPMFALKSPTRTPYMEHIFLRLKEAEFPGDMMQLSSSETQMQARTRWIEKHEDLYQLFVWATQTPDGKIYLTQKEVEQLSDSLKKEIKTSPTNFIITP